MLLQTSRSRRNQPRHNARKRRGCLLISGKPKKVLWERRYKRSPVESEVSLGEGRWGLTWGAGVLGVPWPLPQGQLVRGATGVLPTGIFQEHRIHSTPASSTPLKRPPLGALCSWSLSSSWVRAKWAVFFFIPLSLMQFSEQAFVYPRCSCLCSDLILPIYLPPPTRYLFIMFHFCLGAGAQQICQDRSYLHLGKHSCAYALSSSSCIEGPEKEKN